MSGLTEHSQLKNLLQLMRLTNQYQIRRRRNKLLFSRGNLRRLTVIPEPTIKLAGFISRFISINLLIWKCVRLNQCLVMKYGFHNPCVICGCWSGCFKYLQCCGNPIHCNLSKLFYRNLPRRARSRPKKLSRRRLRQDSSSVEI